MQTSDLEDALTEKQQQDVHAALEAILANERFEAAPQMSAFLRYVVEQAAQGNQNRIKAFTVAVDALGKPETFDPQNDPVVRVLAGRLRTALTAYNEHHPDAAVEITMNRGSYAPQFNFRTQTSTTAANIGANTRLDGGSGLSDSQRYERYADQLSASEARRAQDTASGSPLGYESSIPQKTAHTRETAHIRQTAHNPGYRQEPASTSQTQTESWASRANRYLTSLPGILLVGVLAAVAFTSLLSALTQNSELQTQQSSSSSAALVPTAKLRERPDKPAVFINAIDYGDQFENNLNTVISSAVSQIEGISVLRIITRGQPVNYWREDYILSIAAIQLPDETLVNLQLMQALTGKVIHSTSLSLNDKAAEQLENNELERITEASLAIVREDGPLFMDYETGGNG